MVLLLSDEHDLSEYLIISFHIHSTLKTFEGLSSIVVLVDPLKLYSDILASKPCGNRTDRLHDLTFYIHSSFNFMIYCIADRTLPPSKEVVLGSNKIIRTIKGA